MAETPRACTECGKTYTPGDGIYGLVCPHCNQGQRMECGRKYLFAQNGAVCECGRPCVDHPFALTLGQTEAMIDKLREALAEAKKEAAYWEGQEKQYPRWWEIEKMRADLATAREERLYLEQLLAWALHDTALAVKQVTFLPTNWEEKAQTWLTTGKAQ